VVIDNEKILREPVSDAAKNGKSSRDFYEITIKGYINKQRGVFFKQMKIRHLLSGETCIAGFVKDQTELYSILTFIRDMGIPLLKVEQKQINPE